MQHVQLPLHGGIPLVLLPIRLQLEAGGAVCMSLDISAPDKVQSVSCALPRQHTSRFALSHLFSYSVVFRQRETSCGTSPVSQWPD